MKKTLRERIEALAALNVPALRDEHRKVFGKEPVSSHRQSLFRKIAWRLQADEEDWQPDKLRELARAIARDTPLRQRVITNAGERRAGLPPEQTAVATIRPDHDPRFQGAKRGQTPNAPFHETPRLQPCLSRRPGVPLAERSLFSVE